MYLRYNSSLIWRACKGGKECEREKEERRGKEREVKEGGKVGAERKAVNRAEGREGGKEYRMRRLKTRYRAGATLAYSHYSLSRTVKWKNHCYEYRITNLNF